MTSEKALIYEGVASTFYIILTQGALFTAMALYFGLDAVMIGVTASFPLAFQVVQVVNPWLLRRVRSRKRLLIAANSARFVWIIVIASLVLRRQSAALFIVVFAIAQVANAVAGNTWMSLVRDVVARADQGGFVARRNAFISIITVFLVLGYSRIIDVVTPPWNWALVLLISLVGTVLSLRFIEPVEEPHYSPAVDRIGYRQVLHDANFMRLCGAYFVWNVVFLISAPFFAYHQIVNLGLSMTVIGVAAVSLSVLSVIFYRFWAFVSDRMGTKTILVAGIMVASCTPVLWLLMTDSMWPYTMVADVVLAAFAWAALNIAFIALPLEVSKDSSPGYYAVYFALGGLGGLLGSIIGGFGAAWLNGLSVRIAGETIYGIQFLFVSVGFLRLATLKLFSAVHAERYVPPHSMVINVLSVMARRPPLRPFESLPATGGSRNRSRLPAPSSSQTARTPQDGRPSAP
ncbi:MAG: MFS transporter [Spirochaetaceae bacterium]|nr:MAG: MFS transporter [Spirochaetaceae bacterium]